MGRMREAPFLSQEPKKLNERHHQILRFHLLGWKNKDIAEHLGVSLMTVTTVVNSSLGRLKTQMMSAELDHTAVEAARRIRQLAPPAVQVIEDIMKDEDAPAAVRLNAAKDVLDRAGLAAPKRMEVNSTSVSLSASDLENLKAAALRRAEANGLLIDVPVAS